MNPRLQNKRKIFNDPVYGFITIPNELSFEVVEHPWVQRLRRIRQLGLTHLVYPGALHTRFHHALGAMHLMQQSIDTLRSKGSHITSEEAEGVILAILLHDIGHGPFSHALENCLVTEIHHEELSNLFMNSINRQFNGQLNTCIEIFTDRYHKKFLHQMVSGQLDMDRLDYLTRDSFFTGVSEGVISTDRIIKMLTVVDDSLAVEAKGIYSIENFIVARRLMYWQVYYHKTVVAAEYMLINLLKRARYLTKQGEKLFATPAFSFFLQNEVTLPQFEKEPGILDSFALLDDNDIFTSIKIWASHPDTVLSTLSNGLVNRHLFRIVLQDEPFDENRIADLKSAISKEFHIPIEDAGYFVINDIITNNAYNPESDKINIMDKSGCISDIAEASDQLNIAVLSVPVSKHFLCFPKKFEDL
ncbi:MAG: HD domain-containing protein [Bacteroidales bacterium]